jgi:hypothetical protein
MAGLTDQAGGDHPKGKAVIDQARQAWQESMLRQMETLRTSLREYTPEVIAVRCGGLYEKGNILITLWGQQVAISWPDLKTCNLPDENPCSTFDAAMLLYYLRSADGAPMADRWIGFRELPGGGFYHQAFQGYSGDILARDLGEQPEVFNRAARKLEGWHMPALAPYAYAFQPLPCIRLAAVMWPGDEELPSRASVLFDASASHYMPTDGLALLGAGLARRLIHAANPT